MKKKINKEAQKLIKKFEGLYPERKILFFFVAGSHFFDLATENSDLDFRGIYLPSPKEYYEGESRRKMIDWKTQVSKKGVKNSKEDIDCSFYSLTKFLELLKAGDFNMMEILATPEDKIIINSETIKELRSIRKSIYVNDISAFLGFIKKEYKRYGVNIYHYKSQKDFLSFLDKYHEHTRLNNIWKDIEEYAKTDQHISFCESSTGNHQMVKSMKVAQRLYQNTVKVEYVRDALRTILERYGHRQKNMEKDREKK